MTDLILHPKTESDLESMLSATPHAILVSGVDSNNIAHYIASHALNERITPNSTNVLNIVSEDKKSIGIDQIRSIEKYLSLKVISKKKINRVVIIKSAEKLSLDAQNALLKTLEEPPKGSLLVLSVSNAMNLLPTVKSRLQSINVQKPTKKQLKALYSSISETDFAKAYNLSSGNQDKLQEILNDESHELINATVIARSILSKSRYERVLMLSDITKDITLARNVVFVLQQMSELSLKTSQKNSETWQNILKSSFKAEELLNKNAQAKLVLQNLLLEI